MKTLAIDTATQFGSVALLEGETLLGVLATQTEETYSSRMFRQLQLLLKELDTRLDEIALFSVAAGPGSFTGLRVGLTAVKGWAEVYRRPAAPVSTLEAIAAQVSSRAKQVAAVLDARRGQIYGGQYCLGPEGPVRLADDAVLTVGEFLDALPAAAASEWTFATPTPELLHEAVWDTKFRDCTIFRASAVLAPWVGRLGVQKARRGEAVDALTLDANYVRRSDAELLWKGPAACRAPGESVG